MTEREAGTGKQIDDKQVENKERREEKKSDEHIHIDRKSEEIQTLSSSLDSSGCYEDRDAYRTFFLFFTLYFFKLSLEKLTKKKRKTISHFKSSLVFSHTREKRRIV